MPWRDQGRFHCVGAFPAKVHRVNGTLYWEWQFIHDHLGYTDSPANWWKLRRKQRLHIAEDFSLTKGTDWLRGRRFYESQKHLRHMADGAPRVDMVTTRFLWSVLVDTLANGKRAARVRAEDYINFLLRNVCGDGVEVPVVRRTISQAQPSFAEPSQAPPGHGGAWRGMAGHGGAPPHPAPLGPPRPPTRAPPGGGMGARALSKALGGGAFGLVLLVKDGAGGRAELCGA